MPLSVVGSLSLVSMLLVRRTPKLLDDACEDKFGLLLANPLRK